MAEPASKREAFIFPGPLSEFLLSTPSSWAPPLSKSPFSTELQQNTNNTRYWQGAGQLCICCKNAKWFSQFGKESVSEFIKLNIHLSCDPAVSLLGIYPLCLHSNIYLNFYSNFIHTLQKVEATQVFFSE